MGVEKSSGQSSNGPDGGAKFTEWFVFPTRVFPTRAVCGSGASVEVAPELEVEVRDPYSARADLDPTRGTTTQAKPRTSPADLSQHEQQPSSGPASQVSQPAEHS